MGKRSKGKGRQNSFKAKEIETVDVDECPARFNYSWTRFKRPCLCGKHSNTLVTAALKEAAAQEAFQKKFPKKKRQKVRGGRKRLPGLVTIEGIERVINREILGDDLLDRFQEFNVKGYKAAERRFEEAWLSVVSAWTFEDPTKSLFELKCDELQVTHEIGANVQDAWHGTGSKAVKVDGGIARDSLKPGTYGMFGGAIYVAPDIRKAANYVFWRSQGSQIGIMLKVKVALGRRYIMRGALSEPVTTLFEKMRKESCSSVWGKRGSTASWGGTLRYDEWVVYDPAQVLVTEVYEVKRISSRR